MNRNAPTSLPRQRIKRERNKDYLGFIAALPCLYCGKSPVHVCHVRFTEHCPHCEGEGVQSQCVECQGTFYRFGKRPTGAGEKPSDWWTWPGCPECHLYGPESQHSMNEQRFHRERGVDILALCVALQDAYNTGLSMPDKIEGGIAVLEGFRRAA